MNKYNIRASLGLLFALCLSLPSPCRADDNPPIAVVDLAEAVFASREAKRRMAALRESVTYQRFKQSIESAQSDITNLQDRMTLPQLTREQQQMLQRRIDRIRVDAEADGRKLQQWLNSRKQAIFNELAPQARAAVETLVAEQGLDMLVTHDAIIYARETWLRTESLTRLMDQQHQP